MAEQNRLRNWINNKAKPPATVQERVNYMVQDGALAVLSYYGSDYLVRESVARNDYVLLILGLSSLLISGFSKFAAIGNLFLTVIPPRKD